MTDRSYWELKGSELSLLIADECLAILQRISPGLDLNYTKFSDQGTWKTRIEETGLVLQEGASKRKRLIFTASQQELNEHQELIEELFRACREERGE